MTIFLSTKHPVAMNLTTKNISDMLRPSQELAVTFLKEEMYICFVPSRKKFRTSAYVNVYE
jgi:hypothetical protein